MFVRGSITIACGMQVVDSGLQYIGNGISGFIQEVRTCSCTLEISKYLNYDDLTADFKVIFSKVNEEFTCQMNYIIFKCSQLSRFGTV